LSSELLGLKYSTIPFSPSVARGTIGGMSFTLVIFGVLALVNGLVTLRRGTRTDFYPAALVSLFTQPIMQPDKQRAWITRLGVVNIMLGGLMVLLGVFYHR